MIPTEAIEFDPPVDTRRYWIGVSFFVVVLVAASLFVMLQGSNANLRARHLQPASGSEVSVRPAIRVLFTRAVDKASVERAVSISPEVEFDLSWTENELRILPRTPLQAETEYTVTIGPGVRDASNEELAGTLQWHFRTRQPRIAYIRPAEGEGQELWVSNLDGAKARRLSAPGQFVQDYDAAPNGSMIVYAVEEGPATVNLWRAEPARRGLTRLTDETGVVYGAPRFSPSSDLVAVEVRRQVEIADQGPTLAPPQLELRRPGDGSPAGLVYGEGPEVGHTPRWSPDGTHIAFYEANQNAIGLFNFTSDVRFFPAESGYLGAQAWDPYGRALIYTRVRLLERGAQQVVVLRDLQLGTEIPYGESTGDQGDPAWSPDGSLIAYAYRPPPGLNTPSGIWIMSPDGSGRIPLVSEPDVMYTQPLWSPDGQWLLYARFDLTDPSGGQSIWAIRRDGTEAHQVAEEGYQASWLP